MRTRTVTPSGQTWVKRARWAAIAAETASVARKDHKEGVALCIHLVAVELDECSTQELPAFRLEAGVLLAKLLLEARRSLDVGEEQRDYSGW